MWWRWRSRPCKPRAGKSGGSGTEIPLHVDYLTSGLDHPRWKRGGRTLWIHAGIHALAHGAAISRIASVGSMVVGLLMAPGGIIWLTTVNHLRVDIRICTLASLLCFRCAIAVAFRIAGVGSARETYDRGNSGGKRLQRYFHYDSRKVERLVIASFDLARHGHKIDSLPPRRIRGIRLEGGNCLHAERCFQERHRRLPYCD